jgi:hypothetical protein
MGGPGNLSVPIAADGSGGAGQSGEGEGILAAYGPWWENFRASFSMEGAGSAARGMVFRLNDEGCYVLLFSGIGKPKEVSFQLVKRTFWNHEAVLIVPWKHVDGPALEAMAPPRTDSRIAVECVRDRSPFC